MKNSVFLSRDDALWNDAYLDPWHRDWGTHAFSFKHAADFMVKSVDEQTLDADAVVFPIAFCYRHYVELMLKGLWVQALRLQGQKPPTMKSLLEHNLLKLWKPLRKLLEEIDPGEAAGYDTFGSRITDINDIDPEGQSWKYPFDSKGARTLLGVGPFSLLKLKELMDGLERFLNGAGDYLDALSDAAE